MDPLFPTLGPLPHRVITNLTSGSPHRRIISTPLYQYDTDVELDNIFVKYLYLIICIFFLVYCLLAMFPHVPVSHSRELTQLASDEENPQQSSGGEAAPEPSDSALALVRTVLTELGYPAYAHDTLLQPLRDDRLTRLSQLTALDDADWRRVALEEDVKLAVRRAVAECGAEPG